MKRAKDKRYGVHKVNKNVKQKNKVAKTKNKTTVSKSKKTQGKIQKKPKEKIDLKEFIIKNKRRILILVLILIVLFIIIISLYRIMYMHRNNNIFAQNAEKIQNDFDNPAFKIDKILIYSDANVEDLSENQNLANINISQFTDFAIYISNKPSIEELTEENTVNELYIDNIAVTGTNIGSRNSEG